MKASSIITGTTHLLLGISVLSGMLQAEPFEGIVESVDRDTLQATIKNHGAEGRVMEASIGRGDAAILEEGAKIRGDLVPFGDGYRLQTIWPADPVTRGTIARLGDQLRGDTLQRGSKVFRGVGEYLPKFALYDTDGTLFLSESLKGRYAVMNFIFTRCANAKMCPAATARMVEMQQLALERGLADDLVQVSVTLDPLFDTPGIFTAYAMDKGIDTSRFHLLGGPPQIVEDLKKQMGVLSEPDEEEIIRHTMSTALMDPTGKIIYRIPGSMWNPEAFLKQIVKDKAAK
jgi:protein SCO1/2